MSGADEGMKMLLTIGYGAAYIGLSAGLINFNKIMMSPDHFPFAGALTLMHITTTMACCMVLCAVRPSLFPTMSKTKGNTSQILKYFLPLSLAFATTLVFANKAYQYSSVPFLQFMKQGNVGLIFISSCIVGSQKPDRLKLLTIAVVMSGSATAVHGAVVFVLAGFLCQVVSQCGEICKIMLQERILSGDELKLDPLTYQLFICPGCMVVLCVVNAFTWDDQILPAFAANWKMLVINSLLAFSLNVVIAVFIKHASAMEFILCGVIKDVVLVTGTTIFTGEQLATQQIIGFSVSCAGILYWSLQKVMPNHPAVTTAENLLGLHTKESEPIAPKV